MPRPQIRDLDTLPAPDRSLIDYDRYSLFPSETAVRHAITVQGTRGCPWRCTYCHITWKTHHYRSAESLLEEIKLYADMGVRRFGFVDDIFNVNRKNSERFFNLIIQSGLDIDLFFSNGLRGDLLTPDYIDLMVKAGTVYMPLALDTGSPRLQQLIKKKLKLDRLREALDYLCTAHPDVITGLYFMIGFPTETEEEAHQTLDFVMNTKWIHFPEFFVVHLYPGTELVDLALETGMSRESILRSEDSAVHEIPETTPFKDPAFVSKLRMKFLSRYWMRKDRLVATLPGQMKIMTESELLNYYSGFLQQKMTTLPQLLRHFNIAENELPSTECVAESAVAVPDLHAKMTRHFKPLYPLRDQGMKVLLIDATRHYADRDEGALEGFLHPPIGLMYLATHLHRALPGRVQCKVIKSYADFDSHDELLKIVEEYDPALIGFRSMTYYRDFLHELTAHLRGNGVTAPIIVGGAHPTTACERVLEDQSIDLVVLGEGEETLLELVTAMLQNDSTFPDDDQLGKIAGLAFRKKADS
ncbi:MAG: radical SAM protein [Rhodobacteraceae bacterium]|nr:radical SAM protein [Paracoccaceae bacterium]